MGDEKLFTVQIKGKSYKFRTLTPQEFERVVVVSKMGASADKVIKALSRTLGKAAGPEQWDEITDRYIEGELDTADITVKLFEKLIKRSEKDASPADDAE